jgi:Arf-GAP/SH3 domain/ANK repeat/PH domain-containing protein
MIKFVEYDQRAHKLETLASFAFWVQSTYDQAQTKTRS